MYTAMTQGRSSRGTRATIKLDFFITKRFFWFTSAYFENDRFQDLKLRTALASGPGYQWIDREDFSGIGKEMTLYTEAGWRISTKISTPQETSRASARVFRSSGIGRSSKTASRSITSANCFPASKIHPMCF